MGVDLFDNQDLEALAETATAQNRWEFLLVAGPLAVERPDPHAVVDAVHTIPDDAVVDRPGLEPRVLQVDVRVVELPRHERAERPIDVGQLKPGRFQQLRADHRQGILFGQRLRIDGERVGARRGRSVEAPRPGGSDLGLWLHFVSRRCNDRVGHHSHNCRYGATCSANCGRSAQSLFCSSCSGVCRSTSGSDQLPVTQ